MKYVTYRRVSTQRQGHSGLGLEAQDAAIATYLRGVKPVAEYVEVESGRMDERPELAKAIATCRKAKAVLVIAKLDRLARKVSFIATLMDGDVEFVACDFPQANRLTLHILAAVAEHEAVMISQRTKAALQAAKARGKVLGNPSLDGTANRKRIERADTYALKLKPTLDTFIEAGLTQQQMTDRLNSMGLAAVRGGLWSRKQLQRVLSRLGKEPPAVA